MWYLLFIGVALAACHDQPTKYDCRSSPPTDPCYWCDFLNHCRVDNKANRKHCALAEALTIVGSVLLAVIIILMLAVLIWYLYLRHCCRTVPKREVIVVERKRLEPVVAIPVPPPQIWKKTTMYERLA